MEPLGITETTEDILSTYSMEPVELLTLSQQRNKKYYDNFKKKNENKVKEKFICPICAGSYTYFNKSKHYKGKRHLAAFNLFKDKENFNLSLS